MMQGQPKNSTITNTSGVPARTTGSVTPKKSSQQDVGNLTFKRPQ